MVLDEDGGVVDTSEVPSRLIHRGDVLRVGAGYGVLGQRKRADFCIRSLAHPARSLVTCGTTNPLSASPTSAAANAPLRCPNQQPPLARSASKCRGAHAPQVLPGAKVPTDGNMLATTITI